MNARDHFDRRDVVAMAALVLVLVVMFWKVLFTSQMFFFRDVYNYTYPHVKFIHDAVHHGYLPYWNPLLNYGEPLLADPNFLFFYPTTLLIILLPVAYAYCLHYILHFAIATVGAYCLARQWNQSRLASLFAAAAFGLSGPLLSLGNFYNEAACAAWIPWALFLTEKALARRSRRPWILLTVVFALQFLAGEMFTLLATFMLCFGYALFRAGDFRKPLTANNRRILAGFFLVGVLMMGLSAVQLLPAAHLLAHSRRGLQGLPFRETTYWSFNPLKLVELVLPNFFGTSVESPTIWNFVINGHNNPYLPSVFVGFVTLFFALIGGVFCPDRRKRFVALAAGGLLILSFGRYTPVFSLVYLLFPPLELVRFPVKLLVPWALLVCLLAGWGVDALRDKKTPWSTKRRATLVPLGCLLALSAALWTCSFIFPALISTAGEKILIVCNGPHVQWPAGGRLTPLDAAGGGELLLTLIKVYLPGFAGFLLGGIVWLKVLEQKRPWAERVLPAVALLALCRLAATNYSVNPTVPKAFYTYRPPVLQQVKTPAGPFRLSNVHRKRVMRKDTLNPSSFVNFDSIPWVSRLSLLAQGDFQARIELLRGTMLTGKDVISNDDVDLSFPVDLFNFWVFFGAQVPDISKADCLLGRTNVKYEIFNRPQTSSTLRKVGTFFNGSAEPSYLFENTCAVPRAYVASTALYSAGPLETLARLSIPTFNIREHVILPAREEKNFVSLASVDEGHSEHQPQADPAGSVKILQYQPDTVTLDAEMSRAGYVVLLDRYSPDWRVFVDRRAAPVLRANLMFRAVRVAAGKHLIRFEYQQSGLLRGALITAVTWLLLITGFVLDPNSA